MFQKTNLKKHTNDRFIPRRLDHNNYNSLDLQRSAPLFQDHIDLEQDVEFINYAKKRYNQKNYENVLRDILVPYDVKVLNFFSPKKHSDAIPQVPTDQLWPAKPRKKSVIGQPEAILDMPLFDSDIRHNVADWSSKNCLITISENEVYLWAPEKKAIISRTETRHRVQHCVKWNPSGDQFALGLVPNTFGIMDIKLKKIKMENVCCSVYCQVNCVEWLDDTILLTGCDRGVLKMFTKNLVYIQKSPKIHKAGIINIKSSCDTTLVASSSLDKAIIVWKTENLQPYFKIKPPTIVRALAWHPWRSNLLAIGLGYNEGRVILYNVKTQKIIGSEKNIYVDSSVDALTFNPLTGELVVTYFVTCPGDRTKGSSIIAVMSSNFNNVVEELHIHNGPVPYLLWGSGGKLLASASSDENLCIWNFLGPEQTKKTTPKNSIFLTSGIR